MLRYPKPLMPPVALLVPLENLNEKRDAPRWFCNDAKVVEC
jgi:hypothetical protein